MYCRIIRPMVLLEYLLDVSGNHLKYFDDDDKVSSIWLVM